MYICELKVWVWKSEDNLQELALSYYLGLGVALRSPQVTGFAVSPLTC